MSLDSHFSLRRGSRNFVAQLHSTSSVFEYPVLQIYTLVALLKYRRSISALTCSTNILVSSRTIQSDEMHRHSSVCNLSAERKNTVFIPSREFSNASCRIRNTERVFPLNIRVESQFCAHVGFGCQWGNPDSRLYRYQIIFHDRRYHVEARTVGRA